MLYEQRQLFVTVLTKVGKSKIKHQQLQGLAEGLFLIQHPPLCPHAVEEARVPLESLMKVQIPFMRRGFMT